MQDIGFIIGVGGIWHDIATLGSFLSWLFSYQVHLLLWQIRCGDERKQAKPYFRNLMDANKHWLRNFENKYLQIFYKLFLIGFFFGLVCDYIL